MDSKNRLSSLTFLEACATIAMYEGADKAAVSADIRGLKLALAIVWGTESSDVEPYLVDSLLEMKKELFDLMGVRPEQYANYGGSTWPKVQHV